MADKSELYSDSMFINLSGVNAAGIKGSGGKTSITKNVNQNAELYSKSTLVKIEGPNENVYSNLENSQSLDDFKMNNQDFPIKNADSVKDDDQLRLYKPESNQYSEDSMDREQNENEVM